MSCERERKLFFGKEKGPTYVSLCHYLKRPHAFTSENLMKGAVALADKAGCSGILGLLSVMHAGPF
jgi:hypothetical protein